MFRRTRLVSIIIGILLTMPCFAQSHSPYAGLEKRAIKALSDQQISELRAGLGMSLALAAELNGYPGPRHTIELASELGLTPDQRSRVETLFVSMKAESIAIGEKLIAQEAGLDAQFATKAITPASLAGSVEAIGRTQASLRALHLNYHLLTLQVLTPAQAQRYAELRGYVGAAAHSPARH